MNFQLILNNLQHNRIATNLRNLFNIRDDIRTILREQGVDASSHGYWQLFGDGQNVDGDIETIIDEIQNLVGDVNDGGVAVTIIEKLDTLIAITNQELYGEEYPPEGVTTISEAVMALINKIEELEES